MTQRRFLVLLISLLLLALIHPILSSLDLVGARLLLNIFLTIILFTSIYAVSHKKGLFIITLCLGIPSFGARWLVQFLGTSPGILVGILSMMAAFLIFVAVSMLSHVLKDDAVTGEKISASICVYLLIGLVWACLFSLTYVLQPGSFQLENPKLSDFVYYSYITLSTLGYGDITPLSPPARALAYVEAITGQIYLAVLIARLVALHIAHGKKK
ncbi:MAG: potassium channel family protein [Thermodesulfobacteriota bacterium]|nr:potassium channel family protein [Thermodesulfobacteriota bacterium]